MGGSQRHGYIYKTFDPQEPIAFHPRTGKVSSHTSDNFKTSNFTDPNTNININEFDFGFEWPLTKDHDTIDFDQLTMFLTENRPDAALTATFTITIEQIQ